MKVEQLTITKVLDIQSGTSKSGKEWQKLTFVGETVEEYNNVYAFEIFGAEKVENFNKFNKVGDLVSVEFNVSCNEWKGKYFTSLAAWRVEKGSGTAEEAPAGDDSDDLPF
jgi:hypothetical protein